MAASATSKLAVAASAYDATYEGPWGLKASEEDALLSVIEALYPDFPKDSDGIYAIRANGQLADLAEWLYEFVCSDEVCRAEEPSTVIVEALVPRLEDVLGTRRFHRSRRNAAGQKITRIQSAKKDFAGPSYHFTVPSNMARLIGGDREFAIELTAEGILYRAVSGSTPDLPKWIAEGDNT